MGLKEFLVEAKARLADLNSGVKKHVHIVIGNEACDLDSTVCATTYAYFLHQTKSSPGSHTLPVLCTRRSNFRIHLETVYFLGKHNIRADDLIFIDDLDLPALSGSEVITLEVTLVDHHVLSEAEECLRKFVVEALDHRPVDGEIPKSWHAEIEPVGSCSSIVARKMLDADPEDFSMDATVAELLLGAILTDTCNLSDKDKIATSADREMQVRLKSFLPHISATSIFEEIKQSKFDLSSLTILEMLNKDLKILKGTQITVAMSTITMNLETILTSPEFCHDASEFCLSVPADVIIIMALVMGDAGISDRWIAVFSPNPVFRDQLTDVLLSSAHPNLELEPLTLSSHVENVSAYVQKNVHISRKGVLPLVRDFLAGETTTPDENINSSKGQAQFSGARLESESSGEREDLSEEETRRHINLAKTFQSDLFRTSQDRYDLAAVGMDALISPSLSSDSELGSPQEGARAAEQEMVVGDEVGVGQIGSQPRWDSGSGDFVNGEAGKENTETSAFVNNLIDFDMEKVAPHGEVPASQGEVPPTQPVLRLESIDLFSDTEADMLGADLSSKPLQTGEHVHQPDTLTNPGWGGDAGEEPSRMLNGVAANGDSNNISGVTQADNLLGEDILQNHSPFDLLCPNNVDSPMDVSSMPASGQASGQGSKVPSYPDTPPNSYMEPSGAVYYKETQLPSFNSSEMVQRIQAKKAALGGHGGSRRNKGDMFEEDDGLDGLCVAGEGSSGGGGSLISPAVPQNSYIDLSSGFSYSSSDYQLPKLTNSDIMDRVNEKRSQFEWLVDSLDGSTSGVDVGPNSDEPAAPTSPKASQPLPLRAAMDPQVPYTPQNSYVEGSFDSYAWNNLPSMNNAEMVAKIKAKQSAMYGSSATSGRVSRNSHGSDDSGGCRSPDVAVRGSKCTSLDSPQPFTPQNSYKDNLHLLDSRNRLPDLNEVAERLSVEHSTKRQFAGSGGGSRDEENINLNAVPQNPTRQARHSSSQSDSQNTMSDVESLMSISTDVGTPSDNVVALNLAGLMRNEIAMLSRKDTADSDVFVKLDDTTLAASETKKTGVYFTDSPPKGITFAEQVATSADDGDVAHNGFPGDKELFSPVEESQLRSVEDHAFFQAAESLVAQSVAAAIQASKRQAEREASGRGGRLKWDVTTIVNFADHEEEEEDVSYTNDKSEEEDEEEDISYKVDNRNDNKSEEEYENEGFRHSDDDFTPVDDALLTADNFEEEPDEQHDAPEIPLVNGLDPHVSEHAGADSCDQQLTDLALNELAFEIANELIQNVLNNFNPETMEMEPKPYVGKRDEEVSRRVKWGDSNESAARVPIEALLEESAERRAALDANCSSSSDRSKPKDYDSPFTIVEDEVLTSFPERKPSTELISAEEEEASYSFPGRKFSKSDDFPTRRFSREDNSSRRSSRMDDSDVSVKPEDLETDYLPSMDPLQGNLDIIDASFTKMTDADREVVEGESFRKASGEEGLNREDSEDIELDEESIEEGYRRRIGEEGFDERFVDEVIPEDRVQEDTVPEVPFELKNETLEAVKRSAAKTKKRIRVSFSEDFDDEVGDFNVQLSTRSSLRSPPPPLYTQDSTSSPPEGADDEEEDDLPNFSSASAALKSDLRHNGEEHGRRAEVWNTTVGRISIASEDGESSGRTPSARESELGEPRHPGQQSQVGELIQSAEETISTADQNLLAAALPSPAHQPVLSNHYHDPTSLEYNNSSSSPPSAAPVTSDPSLTSVFPPAQTPLASSVNNLEPHVITSNPTQPPVHVSPLVPATSDPLNTIRHHARNTSLGSIKGAVYTEEWQDDEIEEVAVQGGLDAPPMDSLRKKIVPDSSFLQAIAADDDEGVDQEGEDEDEEPDNESETGDLEWENDTPVKTPPRPGLDTTLTQGTQGEGHQRWKRVSVSGVDFNIDMQAVEPYKNVLSHGGYYAEGLNAIIVFYGCHLPSRRREDYTYIMNHLFHYVIYTLEELVADDYVIIYFHGSTPRRQMPGLGWLKRCYQSIDRRLKKNLKGLFLVHPTLWLKTIVTMIRPFISSKFSSKLRFVRSLEELNSLVPMVNVTIPEAITQLEEILKHNPHYLEEQEEEEKKMMKEEEKASKQREKERKREEKDRKKLEEDRKKLEAKEEKQKKKEEKEREKEKKKAEQKRKSQLK